MRLFILFMLVPTLCLSQESINADQFFLQGLSTFERTDRPIREKVYFPWVDQYEVRTETRDFDFNSQEYSIRVSPSTGRIRNAQKAYYEGLINTPDFDEQEIYCDLVTSLHEDWLTLFILTENQKLLEDLQVILQDKQTIYERMVGTYEFEVEKLVKLQTQKNDLSITLNEIELQKRRILEKYGMIIQEIDFGDFITVEQLFAYLSQNHFSRNSALLIDQETEYEMQLLQREIDLEASENRQLIDFVQVKYTGPHTDLLRERVSVGLGFQLANSGNRRLKMQELQIEQEELWRKSEREFQEQQTKLTELEHQLGADFDSYFHIEKIMLQEREDFLSMSASMTQNQGTSPLFLLEIEERHLSMQLKSIQALQTLYLDYIKYLEESMIFCQTEYKNFLSQR